MMNLSVYPYESVRMQATSSIRWWMTFISFPQCKGSIVDDYCYYILKTSMQRSQTQGLQASIPK